MDNKRFKCSIVLHFFDGGPDEETVLVENGTLEECQKIGSLLNAISYSGSRPNPDARFSIREVSE